MKLNKESLRLLYRLNNIVRYNTLPKIGTETVAAHSYYVVLFTMMICDELNLDEEIKLQAMQMATVHDISESIANDVTHDVKEMIPEIDKLLEDYDKKFLYLNFPDQNWICYCVAQEGTKLDISRLIVKLADVISVWQFADNQLMLGNIYFTEFFSNTMKRINKIKDELEKRNISCQKIMD